MIAAAKGEVGGVKALIRHKAAMDYQNQVIRNLNHNSQCNIDLGWRLCADGSCDQR